MMKGRGEGGKDKNEISMHGDSRNSSEDKKNMYESMKKNAKKAVSKALRK